MYMTSLANVRIATQSQNNKTGTCEHKKLKKEGQTFPYWLNPTGVRQERRGPASIWKGGVGSRGMHLQPACLLVPARAACVPAVPACLS